MVYFFLWFKWFGWIEFLITPILYILFDLISLISVQTNKLKLKFWSFIWTNHLNTPPEYPKPKKTCNKNMTPQHQNCSTWLEEMVNETRRTESEDVRGCVCWEITSPADFQLKVLGINCMMYSEGELPFCSK